MIGRASFPPKRPHPISLFLSFGFTLTLLVSLILLARTNPGALDHPQALEAPGFARFFAFSSSILRLLSLLSHRVLFRWFYLSTRGSPARRSSRQSIFLEHSFLEYSEARRTPLLSPRRETSSRLSFFLFFLFRFRSVFSSPNELLVAVVFRLRFVDTNDQHVSIYIYIFSLCFFYRNELSVVGERETHRRVFLYFCLTDVFFEWHPRDVEREQHHT